MKCSLFFAWLLAGEVGGWPLGVPFLAAEAQGNCRCQDICSQSVSASTGVIKWRTGAWCSFSKKYSKRAWNYSKHTRLICKSCRKKEFCIVISYMKAFTEQDGPKFGLPEGPGFILWLILGAWEILDFLFIPNCHWEAYLHDLLLHLQCGDTQAVL